MNWLMVKCGYLEVWHSRFVQQRNWKRDHNELVMCELLGGGSKPGVLYKSWGINSPRKGVQNTLMSLCLWLTCTSSDILLLSTSLCLRLCCSSATEFSRELCNFVEPATSLCSNNNSIISCIKLQNYVAHAGVWITWCQQHCSIQTLS